MPGSLSCHGAAFAAVCRVSTLSPSPTIPPLLVPCARPTERQHQFLLRKLGLLRTYKAKERNREQDFLGAVGNRSNSV